MALNLTASQQSLQSIFNNGLGYIIPNYQRPYSWDYDQCAQLYSDIKQAYDEGQEYFVGSILLAKSNVDKKRPRVVDGQQRLLTLWLMFKLMHLFYPELNDLKTVVAIPAREGDATFPKLESEIFESDDPQEIKRIHGLGLQEIENRYKEVLDKKGNVRADRCISRLERNLLYLYSWICHQQLLWDSAKMKDFVIYTLENVSILPIELTGSDVNDASDRALVIFETLNNRGRDLEDADVFKERLYRKAKNINEKDQFVQTWVDLKNAVDGLEMKIDDVFRFYSHVIRGRNNIVYGEISLRQFFLYEKYSPLLNKEYKEILDDLYAIVSILQFLNTALAKGTEVARWLQLIYAYTNLYPRYVIVCYLFVNGIEAAEKPDFISLLKSLVRYCYYMGSTTTVKFRIYEFIKLVVHHQSIGDNRISGMEERDFDSLGNLKKGFALLAYVLEGRPSLPFYSIDQIYIESDIDKYVPMENREVGRGLLNSLGNQVVIDINRRSISYDKKYLHYQNSNLEEVRQLITDPTYIDLSLIKRRNKEKKKLLLEFFSA